MENIQSIDNLLLEMRRGVIVLAVLSQCNQEQYGYSLMKTISEKGLEIDQGTLYPLLRRLESQGLLRLKLAPGRCSSTPLLCNQPGGAGNPTQAGYGMGKHGPDDETHAGLI